MTNKELKYKLAKIGYTTLWLDYGVLTIDYLIEQEQIFDSGDDQNTEHYRYQTFTHYLSSTNKLSDTAFEHYLELTLTDNDPLMGGSAAVDLFNKIDLTDSQFKTLCKIIGHFGGWTEKVVTRQHLLRRLRAGKLTTALFNECIASADSVIHAYILNIANARQLQELAMNGKNKKIRNTATVTLNKLARQ